MPKKIFIFVLAYMLAVSALTGYADTTIGSTIKLTQADSNGTEVDETTTAYVEVVPPKYEQVGPFTEGLALVVLNDKSGYIDKTGKEIVPLKYDYIYGSEYTEAYFFSEGLAVVSLNNKFGFVDKMGKEVVPPKYDEAEPFSEGLAIVIINNKKGYIDKTGKEVVPPNYDYAEPFCEGLARVGDIQGSGWRFIDKMGKEVLSLKHKYDTVGEFFSEGLTMVGSNARYGFIDKTGKEVVPLKYNRVESFSEGLAMVELNGKCGYIDKIGKEVVPIKYDAFHMFFADTFFSDGLAIVSDIGSNAQYGFVDKTGKEVVPLKYVKAFPFSEGMANIGLDGKGGFVDKTGSEIVTPKYYNVLPFSEGLAAVVDVVELKLKGGFIDKNGKEVVPLKYDEVFSFSQGLAAISLNGKYGFIDHAGKEVIPVKYDYVLPFSEGLAAVKLNYKWGFIGKTGQYYNEETQEQFTPVLEITPQATAPYNLNNNNSNIMVTLQINNPSLNVNGELKSIDEQGTVPIILNGRTLLPIRAVIEAFGGTVEWDPVMRAVTTKLNGNTVVLTIGNNLIVVNGDVKIIDVPPQIINQRTMVPLRFVTENLGLETLWNVDTRQVTISKK